jgi:hypothetical protein
VALNGIDGEAQPLPDERSERMNRIRVGLTGLAVVLVLVFIATAIIARVNGNLQPNTNATASNSSSGNAVDEPLADLGVAPGASNTSSKANPKHGS